MTRLHTIPQPVIAKVHGVATAAGCQLVAACDLAIAADDARFATPGVNIGLFCSTPMVPISRTIGRKRVLEMLFTGDMIDARDRGRVGTREPRRARRPSSKPRWSTLAERIAQSSPSVLALGKRAFYEQEGIDERAAYGLACAVMVDNAQADDAHEGMRAFLEKRKPEWNEVDAPNRAVDAAPRRRGSSRSRRSGTRRTRGCGPARSCRTSARGWSRSRSAST